MFTWYATTCISLASNCFQTVAEAEDTDSLIREIKGTDPVAQQEAMEDVRTLAKEGKHRRALSRALLELVGGGRHPALDASQRYAVSVLVRLLFVSIGSML